MTERGAAVGRGLELVTAAADLPAYARTLPREAQQARTARLLVTMALRAWGLGGLDDDARLVMTELVSNAVVHARRGLVRVTVTRVTARRVRVAVVDFSAEQPSPQSSGEDIESGRGLAIVEALSGQWGVDPLPWGKRVWAELEAFGAPAEEPAPLDGRRGTA
ncbi:ATP-binding protein [Streptomyces halstedii]|uniref:ATP-binding protein n=1 Tax=Streptomyces halstedii TaxID=1944 RepID=UPI00324F3962